jgi:hypothetical protein
MSVLDKLTEGIVNRDLQKEGAALLNKWEKTGLLEGLNSDQSKDGMARLLENQAKELLREASSMAGSDVEGFAAVAFPIVRRVFGSLIANDLVSVQPMSLPSGLIFFLDFTVDADVPEPAKPGYADDASLYGGGVVGRGLTEGVDLTGANLEAGPYSLNNGFASPTGSAAGGANSVGIDNDLTMYGTASAGDDDLDRAIGFDPDLSGSVVFVCAFTGSSVGDLEQFDSRNMVALSASLNNTGEAAYVRQVRRLTSIHSSSTGDTTDPSAATTVTKLVFEVLSTTDDSEIALLEAAFDTDHERIDLMSIPLKDNFVASLNGTVGALVGDAEWGLEDNGAIPEINIQVDSIAVTAQTKKLKAKWTPELGQDLNAYHNLDAEVELTSILSEQIALEIDREILEDLIKGATAGTQYWSRRPGRFLVRDTGAQIGGNLDNESLMGADFTGTVSEWYETLAETINDVSAQIHRKTLRGGANFVVCSPEVANILEFTAGFRASVTHDADRGTIGAVNVGSLSKKFDVYVDPYFPRNVILVGRKGGSFLESGYVYAPYVPLQVTPTIFGVEDFVPRKGVMTRYAKKMVRPDMYGLVICRDLLG